MLRIFILFVFFILYFYNTNAQIQSDSTKLQFFTPSIDALNNTQQNNTIENKVSVASYTDIDVNEAPSIITIITSEEITQLGARDLTDILNTVPGFNIATDVQNGIAFGIRGNWSHEGKMLYMIDGMTMNELAYGTYVVGNRFPINCIDRIEIIRGAGSSIYGGVAGLGVVNIITKKGQKINGNKLFINGGVSNSAISRAGINYNYGTKLINGTEISFCGLVNYGTRSNLSVKLPDTSAVNFKDSSMVNNVCFYLNIKHKQLEFKQFYEDYTFQATYEPIYSLTRTYMGELNYVYKIKNLTLTPLLSYKWQIPWNSQYGNPVVYNPQNVVTKKTLGGLTSNYSFNRFINLTLGGQIYNESFKYFYIPTQIALGNVKESFNGYSIFGELSLKTKYLDIFAGCRYDQFSYFAPFWAPRFTLTRNFKYIFYKVLLNESYKLPTLQNINLYSDIKPEIIKEGQAQLGFHNKFIETSVTLFINKLQGLIVYNYDTLIESYRNKGNINTKGIEAEVKLKLNKLRIFGNYSYYVPFNSTADDVLIDLNNQKQGTLSFPSHKVYIGFSYPILKNINLNLFETYQSKKTLVTQIDSNGDSGPVEFSSTNNINLTCQINNILHNAINLNFGLYNILDTKNYYGYAYNVGYFPMVGMGRELFLQIKFNL